MPRRSARQTNATASGSKLREVDLVVPDVPSEDGAFDDAAIEEPEDEDEDEDDEPVKAKTRGKRKRPAPKAKAVGQPPAKKVRGTRGVLKALLDMHVDIIYEIFARLDPLDLLHLAWASNVTRDYLMSKEQSLSIWKAARRNIPGLPDCPPDISEPQYANLAFGKACHDCHRNLRNTYTIWAARTRLCSTCMDKKFKRIERWNSFPPYGPSAMEGLRNLLPRIQKGYDQHYYRALDLKWQAEFEELENTEEIKKEWLQAHVTKQEAVNEHAEACVVWHEGYSAQLNQAKASSFQGRVDIILERLETTGWEVEVNDMRRSTERSQRIAEHPAVVKACQKNLTERTIQNLLPALDEYLKSYRDQKVIRDLQELLEDRLPLLHEVVKTYRLTVPPNAAAVDVGDFFSHPDISHFIINTPEISDLSHLDPIRSRLPEIAVELQSQIKNKLFALISAKLGAEYVFDRDTVLELATTIFSCSRCSGHGSNCIRYPRVLAHDCLCKYNWSDESREKNADYKVLMKVTTKTLWNRFDTLDFNEKGQKILADVVTMCGLNPKTVTVDEMDALDPILECLSCNNAHTGRLTMRWDVVPDHFNWEHAESAYTSYQKRPAMKLEILKDEDAETIRRRLNEKEELERADQSYDDLACAHCSLAGNTASLRRHVIKEHGISKPSHSDIVAKIDSKCVRSIFRAWPPRAPEVAVKAVK